MINNVKDFFDDYRLVIAKFRVNAAKKMKWYLFLWVCQVFCVSFKKIFWGGEPPHLYHPTLLNDTLLKCFGNISNRVSCQ